MPKLKVFTKKPTGEKYPNSIAGSIHFAFCEDGETYTELNSGYGILFAKASIRQNNTIDARTLKNPRIYYAEGEYLIFADEQKEDGTSITDEFAEDFVLLFRTKDFVDFEDEQKVLKREFEKELSKAVPEIIISDEKLKRVKNRWLPLHQVKTEKLDSGKAVITYSDGSTEIKKVDISTGEIIKEPIVFPMAVGLADPVVFHWKDSWYFIATNDNVNDIGLFVRKADSVKGLFAEDVETKCILDYSEEKNLIQTFWAPEFHLIGGELYLLFAVSGKEWSPQCHMMKLKKNGDILKSEDWEDPVRVCKKDGSYLTEDGITLDMTYFKVNNISYVVWSYRYGINSLLDTGSMLYIATIDETKPWVLTSDPVLLSRPLFGWENTDGTINNEGPYPLILGEKIYLAFSGGSANGYSYAIGYLVANTKADLLNTENWKKEPAPVLCSTFIPGIEGPGHNSFFYDEDGRLIVTYHAQETENYHTRCTTMHQVHIGIEGFPFLNVAPESTTPTLKGSGLANGPVTLSCCGVCTSPIWS